MTDEEVKPWVLRVVFDMDDDWQTVDDALVRVAGRYADGSGSDGCTRDMDWECNTLAEATKLRDMLRRISPLARFRIHDRKENQWLPTT